jgi:hypothetical protein
VSRRVPRLAGAILFSMAVVARIRAAFPREFVWIIGGSIWHVQRRNEAWAGGDRATAWNEYRFLEVFFAPVLDTPSYVSKTGHGDRS